MSRISKEAMTEYLGANTESATFEDHKNRLLTHPIESEGFAEFCQEADEVDLGLRGRGSLTQFSVIRSHLRNGMTATNS